VQTRTRNSLALAVAAVAMSVGLVVLAQQRRSPDRRFRALDAVPRSALLVAVADLAALRASPVGAPFLKKGREIPGLGKVKDLCGFDPIDDLSEVALAIPESGDSGDFGLVASGKIDEKALITCASKVIEGRGGVPSVTTIGSFRTVRDTSLTEGGGEIAVRDGGPLLLGAGNYLRAMIDTAEKRTLSIRDSEAHGWLGREAGEASLRITAVLSREQRAALAEEQRAAMPDAPPVSIFGGALGVELGPTVALHGLIACESAPSCARLADKLNAARDERAADLGTRLVGFGALFEQLKIEPGKELLHLRLTLPADQAAQLAERLLALRGFRHPMPAGDLSGSPPRPPPAVELSAPRPSASASAHAPVDEVILAPGAHPSAKAPAAPR
jgi:hypothetical protein